MAPHRFNSSNSSERSSVGALLRRIAIGTVFGVVIFLVVIFVYNVGPEKFANAFAPSETSEQDDTVLIESMEFEEEITLLSLGITGVKSEEKGAKIGNWKIPGTTKRVLFQYSYRAKLGIDGKNVTIDKIGDHAYRVSVPEFTFNGIEFSDDPDAEPFKTYDMSGEILSFATEDIDVEALKNEILTTDGKQHIIDNQDELREQAESFFTHIIVSIDPEATIVYSFADANANL